MFALVNPSRVAFDLAGNPIGALVTHVGSGQFPVAPPLYWRECSNDVIPYKWFVSEAGFELVPRAVSTPEQALQTWREGTEVTRFKARAALYETLHPVTDERLYDVVEEIMSSPSTPMIYKLAWWDAQSFRRLSPTVLAIGQLLGLTAEQLDQLFVFAKTIEA